MRLPTLIMPGIQCLSLLTLSAFASAGDLTVIIEDKKQRSVHDTVVELIGDETIAVAADNIEITQSNKEFDPLMSVIPRGSAILFTNKDPFQHHVYSVSKGNRFDLPLYKGTPSELIEFDTPGVAKLGCNIHDWMLAFAYVSQSARLAITDTSGQAHFTDLPAGEYELRIWNPRLKNNKKVISQLLSIKQDGSLEHSVTLSLRKKVRKPPRTRKNDNY